MFNLPPVAIIPNLFKSRLKISKTINSFTLEWQFYTIWGMVPCSLSWENFKVKFRFWEGKKLMRTNSNWEGIWYNIKRMNEWMNGWIVICDMRYVILFWGDISFFICKKSFDYYFFPRKCWLIAIVNCDIIWYYFIPLFISLSHHPSPTRPLLLPSLDIPLCFSSTFPPRCSKNLKG